MAVPRDEFVEVAGPLRRELLAHCYRMTGSMHDAEDLVQETLLRAWRAYDGFEQRASLRTWLHRIATNVCLSALERSPARRVLPSGLGGASDNPLERLQRGGPEVEWLEPATDRVLEGSPGDPLTAVIARESVRLAFIAALQRLPPRQRAILILRDVLAWPTADVAALLETSAATVNGALRRARGTMTLAAKMSADPIEPDDPDVLALLNRYVRAFDQADIVALTELLRADATIEMPPHTTWFRGRDTIARFFADKVTEPGHVRMIATRANGQPAAASYLRESDGTYRANSIHVLSVRDGEVQAVVAFLDPALFRVLDLPTDLSAQLRSFSP